jgi:undecaprenyl-diphosphatase
VLAGGLKFIELYKGGAPVEWDALILGTIISAASAYLCITLFMKLLDRMGMFPFVVYRLLLGGVLLAIYL